MLRKISSSLLKVLKHALAIFCALLVITVFIQVLNRFVLHLPLPWTEEMARYMFVWLSLIGATIAVKEKSHIYMDLAENFLKGKKAYCLKYAVHVINIIFYTVITITGYIWAANNFGNKCESAPIDLFLIYMIVPLCGAMMLFFAIEVLVNDITDTAAKGVK